MSGALRACGQKPENRREGEYVKPQICRGCFERNGQNKTDLSEWDTRIEGGIRWALISACSKDWGGDAHSTLNRNHTTYQLVMEKLSN